MLSHAQTLRTIRTLTHAALVAVPKRAAKLSNTDKEEIARHMEWQAMRLILLGAYLDALTYGEKHETARRSAAKTLIKVRKAMGYSYPERGLADVSW